MDPKTRLDALEPERAWYARLFTALPAPAFVLTTDALVLEANAAAVELLGVRDLTSLLGQALRDWIPAPRCAPFDAGLHAAVHVRQDLDLVIDLPGKATRELKAVVVNIEPSDHTPKLLLLAVDVSREMLLQQRLMQSDRLSQLGALVSGVAHELNNPLAAIAAFGETLAAEAPAPDLRESAGIIQTEAMRAGRIVGTLLDFARQRPRIRAAVDLVDVVQRVLSLERSALKRAQVRAAVAMADDLPAVMGDPQEVQQVVLNAVVNAIQAIEGTGRPGRILIAAQRTEHHVVVSIEDTGPGVPPPFWIGCSSRSSRLEGTRERGSAWRSPSAWCARWAGGRAGA